MGQSISRRVALPLVLAALVVMPGVAPASPDGAWSNIRKGPGGRKQCDLRSAPGASILEGAKASYVLFPNGGGSGQVSLTYEQPLTARGQPKGDASFRFVYKGFPAGVKFVSTAIVIDMGQRRRLEFARSADLIVSLAKNDGAAMAAELLNSKTVLISLRDDWDGHIATWIFDTSKLAGARVQWEAAGWKCA